MDTERNEKLYCRSERFLSSFWTRVFFPAKWHRDEFRAAIALAYAQGRTDQAVEHHESIVKVLDNLAR